MKYGSRRRVWPNIRHLVPLDGCACAFEKWVYGGRKVPYSHDMAYLTFCTVRSCMSIKQMLWQDKKFYHWNIYGSVFLMKHFLEHICCSEHEVAIHICSFYCSWHTQNTFLFAQYSKKTKEIIFADFIIFTLRNRFVLAVICCLKCHWLEVNC